jgi:molybdopterin synthase sulfur carrier subunit
MAVQVKVPTILRSHTGGSKSVEASGDTLDAVLKDVDSRNEGLRARLVDEEGKLHRFVNIYVDDEDVRFNGSLDAPVTENSTVTILPAVAGG